MTGTLWHSYFEGIFRGKPVMTEVKLDEWLPTGWSGTADWIIWSKEHEAFVLGDLKTIKGEGMRFVEDGMKEEHLWQASAYWHALYRMGLPLIDQFFVYYLPMNQPPREEVEPIVVTSQPIPYQTILPVMVDRWEATKLYLSHVPLDGFDNEYLNSVQERVTALRWNSTQNVVDVKLVPHWSAAYCPYPDRLCDCSSQKETKVGHYWNKDGEVTYQARTGYDVEPPELTPYYRKRLIGK